MRKSRRNENLLRMTRPNIVGENHGMWKGGEASDVAKRRRAQRRIPLGQCERCKVKEAVDHHHKDRNTGNNDRQNVQCLCRRCHMIVDGRLAKLREAQKTACLLPRKKREKNPPVPCVNCHAPSKPTRKGRCHNCDMYLRKTGRERPSRLFFKIECHPAKTARERAEANS